MHEGGISTPFIMHWPGVIPAGGKLRHAPAHIIDLVPTVLELAGMQAPDKWGGQERPALPGKSLVPLLKREVAIPRGAIYWQHEGNRALCVGDWKQVSEAESGGQWELDNLRHDRIESKNLARSHSEKVQRMSAQWRQLDGEFHSESGVEKSGGRK